MYVPEWEILADALTRVLATGLDAGHAKEPIGWAIADRKIEVRVHCADGCVLEGSHIDVPKRLNPEDFDWPQSRPRKPWRRRPTVADHYESRNVMIDVSLIELRREDVTRVLRLGTDTAVASTGSNDTQASLATVADDALSPGGRVPAGFHTPCEPWTYYQAVAFLAYGGADIAARYGGPENAIDGGKEQRARDLLYPLRSGLPGIDAVLAIEDPKERDVALYGIVATTTRWRGVGLSGNGPDKQTIEWRNSSSWAETDHKRWSDAVEKHYQALLTGSVTAYRGTAAYAPNSLIDPVAAAVWKRGLDDVDRCHFDAAELLELAERHAKPECFGPVDPTARKLFRPRIAPLRSCTLLDAAARIVYGDAYDERYASAPDDTDAEQDVQRRRKHDQRNGSGMRIATALVEHAPPDNTDTDSAPRSRIKPQRRDAARADVPDRIIEANMDARAAETLAWKMAEEKLVEWLAAGEAEALDRGGNPLVPGFWEANGIHNGRELGYRIRAGGLLRLISGEVPARPSPPSPRSGELACPVTREQFVNSRDPMPLLAQWARWKYGAGKLPGRNQLLADHRVQFGRLLGMSEPVFRELRRKLASEAAKQGGAPTHQTA